MHARARKVFDRFTYANVMSTFAVVLALGTGTAYAANTVFSTDIVDGEVKTVDIATQAVTQAKLFPNAVGPTRIAPDAVDSTKVLIDSLTSADLAASSVGRGELASDSVTGSELAASSVGSSELADSSVTGDKVDESSLGQVPSADKLDGIDSTGFTRGNGRVDGRGSTQSTRASTSSSVHPSQVSCVCRTPAPPIQPLTGRWCCTTTLGARRMYS